MCGRPIRIMPIPGTARRRRSPSSVSPPTNWTKFDYLYILFTEDDAPNPDPRRLQLVADGDGFQLYRILKTQARAGD